MKRVNSFICFIAVILLNGCCLFATDEDLLRLIRQDLKESLRPAFVEALDKAKDDDGNSLYIEEYKDAKVELLDTMIKSIDRVYPPETPYHPEPLPWKTGE